MRVRHATKRQNVSSIVKEGLRPDLCKGKIQAVWLHTQSKSAWAILHTQKRHKVSMDDIVILEIEIPRSWLRRWAKGIWLCERNIPFERVVASYSANEFAK